MIKTSKILIEINEKLKLVDGREYDRMIKKAITFKLMGYVNENLSNKLNIIQKERLIMLVKGNSHYLAHKSPETLIKNFKESILKEL